MNDAQKYWVSMMSWLIWFDEQTTKKGAILLARSSPDRFWAQVGFTIINDVLNVKVGDAPYQPIGELKGSEYRPTEGCKLLWVMEFKLATPGQIHLPFQVEHKTNVAIKITLTDKDRAKMADAMKLMREDLTEHKKLADVFMAAYQEGESTVIATAKTKMEAHEEDMKDTIKLCAVQCGVLNIRLQQLAREKADFKMNLVGVRADTLAESCVEWLRMKLDDDSVEKYVNQTTMTPIKIDMNEFLSGLRTDIESLAQKFATDGSDENALALVGKMTQVEGIVEEAAVALKPFKATSNLAEAASAMVAALNLKMTTKESDGPQPAV